MMVMILYSKVVFLVIATSIHLHFGGLCYIIYAFGL